MRAAALVLCVLLSGCTLLGHQELPPPPTASPTSATGPPTPREPPLVFTGVVRDAATGELLPDATAILELAQSHPCLQPGLGWRSWDLPLAKNASFGPLEVPRPRSDDVAFFVHVNAPGYTDNVTPVGPTSRTHLHFDVALHPQANVTVHAPPGTLVALEWPGFPRVGVAGPEGRVVFGGARSVTSFVVVGTDAPWTGEAPPGAELAAPAPTQRGWTLEGTVKGPTGAGVESDVVAFNGTVPVGVARSGPTGHFAMPLPREIGRLDLVARTPGGALGGGKVVEIAGPPALTETLLLQRRC